MLRIGESAIQFRCKNIFVNKHLTSNLRTVRIWGALYQANPRSQRRIPKIVSIFIIQFIQNIDVAYANTCLRTQTVTHTHIRTHTYTQTHVMRTSVAIARPHTSTHTHTNTNAHTHTHTQADEYTHTHTYAYTHKHSRALTHTHT